LFLVKENLCPVFKQKGVEKAIPLVATTSVASSSKIFSSEAYFGVTNADFS
jgi:hypothetical protein